MATQETDLNIFDDVDTDPPSEGSLEVGLTDLDSVKAQKDPEESLDPMSPSPCDDHDIHSVSESLAYTNSPHETMDEDEADYDVESPPKSPKRQKSVSFFLERPSLSENSTEKSIHDEENNDDWAKKHQGKKGKVSDLISRFNEGNIKQNSSTYKSYKHEYGIVRNIGRIQQTKFH